MLPAWQRRACMVAITLLLLIVILDRVDIPSPREVFGP